MAKIQTHSPEWARRKAWRIFRTCCERYGVSAFDLPTFAAVYPLHYRVIRNLNANAKGA
jgi:hypothetical protein